MVVCTAMMSLVALLVPLTIYEFSKITPQNISPASSVKLIVFSVPCHQTKTESSQCLAINAFLAILLYLTGHALHVGPQVKPMVARLVILTNHVKFACPGWCFKKESALQNSCKTSHQPDSSS